MNGFIKKIPSFIRYKLFAQKIIRQNKYDKLIVLHSTPGLVLLNILRKYKNKFILDYRDFSHENIYLYRETPLFINQLDKSLNPNQKYIININCNHFCFYKKYKC